MEPTRMARVMQECQIAQVSITINGETTTLTVPAFTVDDAEFFRAGIHTDLADYIDRSRTDGSGLSRADFAFRLLALAYAYDPREQ